MKAMDKKAIDALNAHIQALNEVIASARAKNAALVAALENIKDVADNSELSDHDARWSVYGASINALAANEKGGNGE